MLPRLYNMSVIGLSYVRYVLVGLFIVGEYVNTVSGKMDPQSSVNNFYKFNMFQ